MLSALIVSYIENSVAFLSELLHDEIAHITSAPSCAQARRLLLEQDFDLVVINTPLKDETGENLAKHIAAKGISQVILIVSCTFFEEMTAVLEDFGVLTVAKPLNKAMFWSALKLAKSAHCRLKKMQAENTRLKQKIEDIRLIDRAKCLLISYLNMNEGQAHRYIEKQAMDMRQSKRAIAEEILKTYEN